LGASGTDFGTTLPIGGVGGGFEFGPAATGGAEGGADGVVELGFADVGGAGSGEEEASIADAVESEAGEAVVGLDGSGAFGFAFGHGGWIEDDGVEGFAGCAGEPFERVGLDLMVGSAGDGGEVAVEVEVAAGGGEGVWGDVEVGHRAGPAAGGVDGETAGEAEHVEDIAAAGEGADAAAVVALVEEEAGFLALDDVGFEAEAVFEEDDRRGGVVSEEIGAVGAGELGLERAEVPADAEDDAVGGEEFLEERLAAWRNR
jgi:hypothetical protein